MPDLDDLDESKKLCERGVVARTTVDAAGTVVSIAGVAVALAGIIHGLRTGYDSETVTFAVAGIAVFAMLALTCLVRLLMDELQVWAPRAFLASLFGLSIVRLLGYS